MEIGISKAEIKNIVSQYEYNDDCLFIDDDVTIKLKKAMDKLEKGDFIIYCLYLEIGVKSDVAKILGVSRISLIRILKNIEDKIKEYYNEDID